MAFWITDKAQEWVEAAETESGHSTDAVWASKLLSDDLMRGSRWWLGLAAFVLAFVAAGAAGSVGMMLLIEPPIGGDVIAAVLVMLLAIVVLVAAVGMLWQLHRSGRRLAHSLRWWLALRADAVPNQGFAGWVGPRAALFNPSVFVRVLTATLAGLVGIFGFSMIGYALTENAVLLISAALWGVLGTACLFGQLGGVMKLVAGLGDADPMWSRIRGR
ncbi:hypothetical protein [Nocardioides albus]|uniref:Uncharacterized protein n=1 Tax=Nocardioides albus TaxID=1841 RepID=A0A7W5A3K1_9ACTN|nr:hypothetical protein [Nocardioides albus]MBB3089041.1 hypothetical protein [Nocardioides albus]GGU14631.1 hypothetical protein GCM10007979_11460 [Nocardioides albus]